MTKLGNVNNIHIWLFSIFLMGIYLFLGCKNNKHCTDFITKPRDIRMVINEGDTITNDTLLRISISGLDIDRMIITADSLWRGSEWEDYISLKNLPVPKREGRVNVYGRFATNGGGTTDVYQASINLDLTAQILSFDVLAPNDTLHFGDEVRFIMSTGEPGNAEISFGNFLSGYNLDATSYGQFSRVFTIPIAVADTTARVVGFFTDIAGNRALPFENELRFVVISNPFSIQHLGSLRLSESKNLDIEIKGEFCFISDARRELLHIVDIHNLSTPTLHHSLPMTDWTAGLCSSRDYLFVADGDGGIAVVGVNPPGAAVETTRLYIYGKTRDVKLVSHYLYAVCLFSGLWIIDINEIYNYNVVVNVSLTGFGERIILKDDYAYIIGASGLSIVNIKDLNKIKVVSEMSIQDVPSDALFCEGHIIISTIHSGIKVIDVRNPARPMEKYCYREFYGVRALASYPPYIFAGMNDRILIINAGHINQFTSIGQITGLKPVNGLCPKDNLLYVATDDMFEIVQLY